MGVNIRNMRHRSAEIRERRPAGEPASGAPVRFTDVLTDAAGASGLSKTQRTRLRLLASIARQISDGTELGQLRVVDVTATAGLALGTFYRYFVDLRSAVEATISEFATFLHNRMVVARDGIPGSRERVRGATLVYTRLFRANAGLMFCLISLGRENAPFLEAFQRLNQAWNERMALAISRRRLVSFPQDRAKKSMLLPRAYALGGMIDEFLTQLYLRQDPALTHLKNDENTVADLLTELWCLGAYGHLPSGDKKGAGS